MADIHIGQWSSAEAEHRRQEWATQRGIRTGKTLRVRCGAGGHATQPSKRNRVTAKGRVSSVHCGPFSALCSSNGR